MSAGTLRRGEIVPGDRAWLVVTLTECKDGRMTDATHGPWYWCLIHARVEGAEGCANDERMGPYETREEAETALRRAHERTEAWDDEDDRWAGRS